MREKGHGNGQTQPDYQEPEGVIRAILQMEKSGASLKSRRVRESDKQLFDAANRHFGCWGKALRAVGIDSEAVANRRSWTVDRVLTAIRDLNRRGVPLNYASVHKADGGLPQAARKLLGSWNDALRAAGFDPEAARTRRRPWTREEVIDLIRARAAAGLPIASYTVVPASAEAASRQLFGSWKATLRVAGVPNPSVEYPVWTKVSVVEAILVRQQAGEPLYCLAAAQRTPRLYDAARRCFGSWHQALCAAGIDPESVRRKRRPWTSEEIIACLKLQARGGEDISRPSHHPESFVKAARRLFGNWDKALDAAGVPLPQKERKKMTRRKRRVR